MSLAVIAVGCSGGGPDIVPVSGTVTRNGKPVPNVTIYFQPTSGRPSLGECDDQGRFKLRYTHDQDGAKVGMHSVYIVYFPDVTRGAAPADFKEIAAKYSTPETSPLKIELKRREDNLQIKLD
jgi:hypothetical protein